MNIIKPVVKLIMKNPAKLEIAAVFHPSDEGSETRSLCFHEAGHLCVSCGSDGSIRLIDTLAGASRKLIYVKKYNTTSAAYTHHELSILHGGNDNNIRYLSLYDNKYLRVFRGHEDAVTCVSMCPSNDAFASCSLDGKMAVWDLGSSSKVAVLDFGTPDLNSPPRAAYSPDGLVLAVSAGRKVRLYDSRGYQNGPFAHFDITSKIDAPEDVVARLESDATNWTGLEFSQDGERLLVHTDSNLHLLYDAFDFNVIDVLYDATSLANSAPLPNTLGDPATPSSANGTTTGPFDATPAVFSPDNTHVIAGTSLDNDLRVWRLGTTATSSGRPHILKGHACPVHHLAYSPNFDVLASACAATCLWLPPQD